MILPPCLRHCLLLPLFFFTDDDYAMPCTVDALLMPCLRAMPFVIAIIICRCLHYSYYFLLFHTLMLMRLMP